MTTPLHFHPNDGSFYPDCARCRIERAAPELLETGKDLLSWLKNGTPEGAPKRFRAALAKAQGGEQ